MINLKRSGDMSIWKITSNGPIKVAETKLKQEKFLEENLEDWICQDASILGEPLLIIGRQVVIPDVKDRLDILALDIQGNAVIIELKRGTLKDPVDIQALRYASYISKWGFEDFENTARNYFGKIGDADYNFNAEYESFCEESGIDEIPDLNQDQRTIIVGNSVREKLGSVALWLYDHSIDIKVVEVNAYKDDNSVLIEPNVVVPIQVSKFADTGIIKSESTPWLTNGREWHLDKRCTLKTKEILLKLDNIIQENLDVDGPRWNQKFYVSYRINNYNWLAIITHASVLRLDFLVKSRSFKIDELSETLNLVKFEKEESFSEKIALPSSVLIKNRNENTDRISIRIKEDYNLESEEFLKFLMNTVKAFPK